MSKNEKLRGNADTRENRANEISDEQLDSVTGGCKYCENDDSAVCLSEDPQALDIVGAITEN